LPKESHHLLSVDQAKVRERFIQLNYGPKFLSLS